MRAKASGETASQGTRAARAAISLEMPLRLLEGVGAARAEGLAGLGLNSVGDLLEYLPRRYQYETAERLIGELEPMQIQTARGRVVATDFVGMRPRPRFEATLDDESGRQLEVTWFNGGYLRGRINPGLMLRVRGKVQFFGRRARMANPKWELITEDAEAVESETFRPIYPASGQVSSEVIGRLIARYLDEAAAGVREWFGAGLLAKYELLGRREAYRLIHQPSGMREAASARRRLVWDELMLLQLGVGISKRQRDGAMTAPVVRVDERLDARIRGRLGVVLTGAQDRAVADLVRDVGSGRPMHRLIQGDVGSGKTAVALYGMLATVANRMQAAILAPTEVLAEQHYLTLTNLLRGSKVGVELYTSRTRGTARRNAKNRGVAELFADGEAHIAVGTQALLQGDVGFANLGLVVVDEQHKLGVQQREILRGKGAMPHYLVMTATPIPRTLALSYFADFDLSVIDELPPGRKPIKTRWLRRDSGEQAKAYEFVRKQVAAGRQAYVVLPQIDETGVDDARSVRKEFVRLGAGPLKGLRLGMLHGQLRGDEKQDVMTRFREGAIDVLVTTTVIEVGIDVANATVILIDNAERFGLSQLHQLRGRVGRGAEASFCLLVGDAAEGSGAAERLRALVRTGDGFEIAEMDLKLRGPGEFFGTRQHGMPELKVADLSKEMELLKHARTEALALLDEDPELRRRGNAVLRGELMARFGGALELARIG